MESPYVRRKIELCRRLTVRLDLSHIFANSKECYKSKIIDIFAAGSIWKPVTYFGESVSLLSLTENLTVQQSTRKSNTRIICMTMYAVSLPHTYHSGVGFAMFICAWVLSEPSVRWTKPGSTLSFYINPSFGVGGIRLSIMSQTTSRKEMLERAIKSALKGEKALSRNGQPCRCVEITGQIHFASHEPAVYDATCMDQLFCK